MSIIDWFAEGRALRADLNTTIRRLREVERERDREREGKDVALYQLGTRSRTIIDLEAERDLALAARDGFRAAASDAIDRRDAAESERNRAMGLLDAAETRVTEVYRDLEAAEAQLATAMVRGPDGRMRRWVGKAA